MSDKKTPCSLNELAPAWVGHGGEGVTDKAGRPVAFRPGVAVAFDCPCGCESRICIHLANPLDGGAAIVPSSITWHRKGDRFESLTLHPSIRRRKVGGHGCTWHGWVELGQVRDA